MQGGGYDRKWYEPLKPDGNREIDIPEETIGCHTGPYAGLNVANPQPGYEYTWQLNDHRQILLSRMRGGEVVTGSDPEFSVYSANIEDMDTTPLDSSQLYKELVLIRTPIEKVREQRLQEQQKAEAMARGSVRDYLDQVGPVEADYGRRDGRGPTRLTRSDHSMELEEDGRTTAVWTPHGIVRR
jgi:hypothetical protein